MRVLKWVIPADDRDHPCGTGPVIHVDLAPSLYTSPPEPFRPVAVWTVEPEDNPEVTSARVYGTGHIVPDGDEPCGSVVTGYGLVWHVFRGTKAPLHTSQSKGS